MTHVSRVLAHRTCVPSAILYNDAVIRGPSQLPEKVHRRAYHTQRRRNDIPPFGDEDGRSTRHIPQIPDSGGRVNDWLENAHHVKHPIPKKFSQRHKYSQYNELVGLLDKGAIVEAMTRFKIACNEWRLSPRTADQVASSRVEISPHIIDDMMVRLSRLARSPRRNWDDYPQIHSRSSYWTPGYLPAQYDIKRIHVCVLSYYALLDVYDISSSLNFLPSKGALSALILALSHVSTMEDFVSGTTEILLRCSGRSLQDSQMLLMTTEKTELLQQLELDRIPIEIICSMIKGYGKKGKARQGEMLLHEWSGSIKSVSIKESNTPLLKLIAQWKNAKDRRSDEESPMCLDSSAWTNQLEAWSSLIQSREASGDLAGARYWLQRYRMEGLAHHREHNRDECHQPHVAYLIACTRMGKRTIRQKGDGKELETDEWIAGGMSRVEAVQDVVKMMHTDGTTISIHVQVLLFNFYAGCRMITEAQAMRTLLDKAHLSKNLVPKYYNGVFHLYCLEILQRGKGIRQDRSASQERSTESLDLRQDFNKFFTSSAKRWTTWSNYLKREILNHALRASLMSKDFPLASRILRTFRDRRLQIDHHTAIVFMSTSQPERLEEIRKSMRVHHHQQSFRDNMIRYYQESATEEMPFETHIINSMPKEGVINKDTPWRQLLSMISYLDKHMVSLMQKEPRHDDADWLREAKDKLTGQKRSRKVMVNTLLAPFPERQMRSSSNRKQTSVDSSTSINRSEA